MFVVSVRERGKEEHKFTFRKTKISIGRLRANDIILPKRNVSKKHAELEVAADNSVLLLDMGSTNGSFINGKRIVDRATVTPEDKLFIGDYLIVVEVVPDRSAIDGTAVIPQGSPAEKAVLEAPGQKEVDLDADLLEAEMRRLGLHGQDGSASATVVVGVRGATRESSVEKDGAVVEEISLLEGTSDLPEVELVEPSASDVQDVPERATLRVQTPARAPASEDDLLDIPLMEEEVLGGAAADAPAEQVPFDMSSTQVQEAVRFDRPAPTPAPVPAAPRPAPAAPLPAAPIPDAARVAPAATYPSASTVEGLTAAPRSSTQQVRFLVPAEGAAQTVADALNAAWLRIEQGFEAYLARSGSAFVEARALEAVSRVVQEALAGVAQGPAAASVAAQALSEITGLGPVGPLLENAKVGEVFVASSGRVTAYDWRGNVVTTTASFSCPVSVQRMAERLARQAGQEAGTFCSFRMPDGTVARLLGSPLIAAGACMRFVRPFRTDLTLGKLKDTGLATDDQAGRMRTAVLSGRSLLLLGRETETLSIVTAAAAAAIQEDRKVLAAGDRFAGLAADRRFVLLDTAAVNETTLMSACAALDCHWIVLDLASPAGVQAALKAAAQSQVPFILSVRTQAPASFPMVVQAFGGQAATDWLSVASPLVVTTRRGDDGTGRVDAVLAVATQPDGKLKLVPAP
jgi:pilus assembly protein CpaF